MSHPIGDKKITQNVLQELADIFLQHLKINIPLRVAEVSTNTISPRVKTIENTL